MRLSEWAEQTIYLPSEVSAVPGKLRLLPYQREIADAIGDPAYSRVSVIKSVRVGYTTLLTSALAHFCVNDPAAILSVLPRGDDCRRYIVDDVEPIFAATPELRDVLSGATREGGRNTINSRRFPGGFWKIVAAEAPRNLASHNIRVLFMDEVDHMEITSQGDPVDLATRRLFNTPNSKIVMGSTPLEEATSFIMPAYEASDQRIFEVPCPHCGEHHDIKWADIKWPEKKPEEAYWCCPDCGGIVEDRDKMQMVNAGRWRATKPHVVGHAGFRLTALISPVEKARWGALATEFVAAKKDPEKLRSFVNTILGEVWRSNGDDIDENELASRAEDFGLELAEDGRPRIPEDVLHIGCGVDIQPDRAEATCIGFNEHGHAYVLGHSVFYGMVDGADASVWRDLDTFLRSKWRHPLGGEIGISATCVDTGDGNTIEVVKKFCLPRFNQHVYPIKGDNGKRPWIEISKTQGRALFIVGVDGIKLTLVNRVRGKQMLSFSSDLPPVWFQQFTGQRLVEKYQRGVKVLKFEDVPGRRQEAWDCAVYAHAASRLFPRATPEQRRGELSTAPEVVAATRAKPRVRQSEWLNRLG